MLRRMRLFRIIRINRRRKKRQKEFMKSVERTRREAMILSRGIMLSRGKPCAPWPQEIDGWP